MMGCNFISSFIVYSTCIITASSLLFLFPLVLIYVFIGCEFFLAIKVFTFYYHLHQTCFDLALLFRIFLTLKANCHDKKNMSFLSVIICDQVKITFNPKDKLDGGVLVTLHTWTA